MLVTAAYEGPPYNPVTPSPVPTMATAPPPDTMALAGLGNRRINPVPNCVNCVAGFGATTANGTKVGLWILGALAVFAIGLTIYGASKK